MFEGKERFPDVAYVNFVYFGYDVYLTLKRNDDYTAMLSETVFEISHFLPSGVFADESNEVGWAILLAVVMFFLYLFFQLELRDAALAFNKLLDLYFSEFSFSSSW